MALAETTTNVTESPWVDTDRLRPNLFIPTTTDTTTYGQYRLTSAALFPKPADLPNDYIAYNPSGIWTIPNGHDQGRDIMYVRVEPDRSYPGISHLGKAVARPYLVHQLDPTVPLIPYTNGLEIAGEDPSLTRINRRLPVSGKLQSVWLLGVVNAQPTAHIANEVESLQTEFFAGESLSTLEKVASGPPWMKDIRVVSANPNGTELAVWGRPQPMAFSGNITHTQIPDIEQLTAQTIAEAHVIHPDLLPVGSGVWGGVNDVIRIGTDQYILAAHRAYRTGDGSGRHYEAVLYGHNTATKTICELGVIATADMFPLGKVKDDALVDLHDVTFTGGAYNGQLSHLTFGVRDGSIGIGGIRRAANFRK